MKTLFIARHAKSGWDYPNVEDIDRPLTQGGIHAAYEVSQSLKKQSILPDAVLSSPANRAIHTALIHCRVLGFPEQGIEIHPSIYHDGEFGVLKLLHGAPSSISSIMVVGHNPTLTLIAQRFAPYGIENLQTSGVVKIEFQTNKWLDVSAQNIIKATYFKRNEIVDLNYDK
ncbi:MAG: histidine phosphatase family protein [Flavobacteriales bacterium]|nr:histidine phosphatase family protein [Flavobacteriales bacterium]